MNVLTPSIARKKPSEGRVSMASNLLQLLSNKEQHQRAQACGECTVLMLCLSFYVR